MYVQVGNWRNIFTPLYQINPVMDPRGEVGGGARGHAPRPCKN